MPGPLAFGAFVKTCIACFYSNQDIAHIRPVNFSTPCKIVLNIVYNYSNNCKTTAGTHTKRIDRNLLCKETSFMCYTSSVLLKSRHMKQKEKNRTVAKIKTQDYKNEDYKNWAQLQLLH